MNLLREDTQSIDGLNTLLKNWFPQEKHITVHQHKQLPSKTDTSGNKEQTHTMLTVPYMVPLPSMVFTPYNKHA